MLNEVRIISLWQPWATLIAMNLKQYETRSFRIAYRGRLAIHAAKRKIDAEGAELLGVVAGLTGTSLIDLVTCLPLGYIVAIADLTHCRQMISAKTTLTEFSKQPESVQNSQIPIISLVGATELERSVGDWQPGRYAWKLENVRPIAEPIPYRGKQGLTVIRDEAILQAIEVQLTKTAEIEQQLQAIGGGAL